MPPDAYPAPPAVRCRECPAPPPACERCGRRLKPQGGRRHDLCWYCRVATCRGCGAPRRTTRPGNGLCRACESARRRREREARRPALCLRCGRRPPNRPRGLCWTCYFRSGDRLRYGGHSEFTPWVHRRDPGSGQRLPEPTDAPPGSPGKVEALAARAAAGEGLWSRGDARDDDRARGWPAGRVVNDAGPRRRTG
jgi:hypothetical protein